MSRFRKFAVAGGTFGVALSIGFVMQNGDALAARYGTEVPLVEGASYDQPLAPVTNPPGPPAGTAGLSDVTGPPQSPATAGRTLPQLGTTPVPQMADGAEAAETQAEGDAGQADLAAAPERPSIQFHRAPPSADGGDTAAPIPAAAQTGDLTCDTQFVAQTGTAAMVDLTLIAPCSPDTQVSFHHEGMIFTLLTDETGVARVAVPALAETAVFIADVTGASGAVATAEVPALLNYDRAVLQWQGESGLQIHALEFGADYGSDGHVWDAAMRDASVAMLGEGGFLTRLGDGFGAAPMTAEVYTFPSAISRRSGAVQLSVEAEITADSCGRDVAAQSIQISPGTAPKALDLTMAMPDCNAVGDFLVLKNMLADLTLAAR